MACSHLDKTKSIEGKKKESFESSQSAFLHDLKG